MRRVPPFGRGGRRALKRVAVITGSLLVLLGIAALVGDPDAAQGRNRTAFFARALRGLRDAFGDPGGGIAMIVLGVLLGSFLYWLASRRD